MDILLDKVGKVYNSDKENACQALRDIDLSIASGTMCAIIGPSGSGKSTLLRILGCLDLPSSGICKIGGMETGKMSDKQLARMRNTTIGFVMQEFGLIEDRSVLENVCIPLYFSKAKSWEYKKKAVAVLSRFGLETMLKKDAAQLSGGQKQRLAIARALICEPAMILADEPTGALDTQTASDVLHVFHDLRDQDKTVIMVTHNPQVANQCERVLEIIDGRLQQN